MRIQTKLFILLLVIAIGPLVALSWRSERATENLGAAIVERGQDAVVREIENQLSQAVAYSSDLLTAQQRQVEFALRLQASAAARLLSGPVPSGEPPRMYFATDFDDPRTWPPDTELTLDHAISSPEGSFQAVPVSRQNQAFLLAPGVARQTVEGSLLRLMPLVATYREINRTSAGLFYWQYVSLTEGLHSVYPGHGGYPATYDPRKRVWYTKAMSGDDLIWTQPFLDAATRRLLLTAAMPVHGADGTQAGVTGIDIDILKVLGDIHGRVQVGASDEVKELANAFNAIIPQLRNHISVMESLSLAREVQQKLLPTSAPALPGFEFAGRCVYSEDVGGDYYDFVRFGEGSQAQRVGVFVGDVAGHGVVAALTMTSVRALLRSHAGDGRDLRSAMDAVNRYLAADSAGGRFVTLLYLVIDPGAHSIRWVSAGHGPNLIYDVEADQFEELAVHDIPLGVKTSWSYQECVRTDWPKPGLLIMGTDGIWETCNSEGQSFGTAGLKTVVRAVAHLSAEEICDKIVETLHRFSGGAPQRDDITLVVVKFLPAERSI